MPEKRRFIPAGAGNTSAHSRYFSFTPVYPRWRGEHFRLCASSVISVGLSPLARGTRCLSALPQPPARFIPAGAGNTRSSHTGASISAVYPRWRGEHVLDKKLYPWSCGLSPLARGTLARTRNRRCSDRFIPAGAGNTHSDDVGRIRRAVYPRWRGEHRLGCTGCFVVLGLSPLARGTQLLSGALKVFGRFIPAGAGNTVPSHPRLRYCAVYPRWRGEHAFQGNGAQSEIRFIPAGAGNTP